MTIARDIRTGAVVGQVTDAAAPRVAAVWQNYPHLLIRVLGRDGYVDVSRSSVTLEEHDDN